MFTCFGFKWKNINTNLQVGGGGHFGKKRECRRELFLKLPN